MMMGSRFAWRYANLRQGLDRQGSQLRKLQPAASTIAAARAAHASSQRRNLKRNLYGVRRVANPKWKTRLPGLFGRRHKRSASCDLRRQPAAIVCEQKFSTTANVHDIDVRWHSCDMCERKFKRVGHLKQHRADVHDIGVRWHSCDMCEQQFKQSQHLKQHRAAARAATSAAARAATSC